MWRGATKRLGWKAISTKQNQWKFNWQSLKFTTKGWKIYINKIQSVSGCHNLIVSQTAVKFGKKAQLNHVGKIAIVLYL